MDKSDFILKQNENENSEYFEEVAIIGMSCRFPGARNVAEFWQNLCDGYEARTLFSDEELAASGIKPEILQHPNYVKAGFVLEDIEIFDATFFGFSPRQAQLTDPQQRLFLECAWKALESAGCDATSYDGLVGVYAGASMSNYFVNYRLAMRSLDRSANHLQTLIGNDKDYLATQTAYKLNLTGPCVNVQTACSTGLVAVHLACQSLLNKECDVALAGAVTVRVPHKAGYFYQEGAIFSPDGHCRTFDAKAQGTVFGSGVGIVVLKRLSDAIAEHDNILAVVKGSAINNDGSLKVGFTAPSENGQSEVIDEALGAAGIDPSTITYIEAHGTGTPIGDPIEIAALNTVFAPASDKTEYCAIGSVKTNVGHLESAAGVAGLIKTVLALEYKRLPPSLHFCESNPEIDLANMPFYVNTRLSEWRTNGGPRRAGVSSFGIGGTNAHVVLEEAPLPESVQAEIKRPLHLLCLSAKSEKALTELVSRYEKHLAQPHLEMADVCFTANSGRTHFPHRLSVVASSTRQATDALRDLSYGQETRGIAKGTAQNAPPIAFLFTGQGSQYVGMGQELYETQPTFRRVLQHCDDFLRAGDYLPRPLLEVLYPEAGQSSPIDQTAYTQVALFALEYALAKLWQSWAIQPTFVMGHSAGEIVAACVAGVFSLSDGLKLVAERGRLMQSTALGQMVAVMAGEAQVRSATYGTTVAIAAINGPKNVVISGETQAVQRVVERLERQGVNSKRLRVSHAFHSPLMDPILKDFLEIAQEVQYSEPQIGLLSNVTGALMGTEVARAEYWARHLMSPVRFYDGIKSLRKQGVELFIEVGPKPILLGMGRRIYDSEGTLRPLDKLGAPLQGGAWLPTLRPRSGHGLRPGDEWQELLTTLGELYVRGVEVDWAGFDQDYARRKVLLPTYPFQRERYWLEKVEQSARRWDSPLPFLYEGQGVRAINTHPLLGQRLSSALAFKHKEILFTNQISQESPAYLAEHRVFGKAILPATAYLEMALAAGASVFSGQVVVENVLISPAMRLHDTPLTVQLLLTPFEKGYSFEIFSQSTRGRGGEGESGIVGEESWTRHATGQVVSAAVLEGSPPPSGADPESLGTSLATLQARGFSEMSLSEYYQQFAIEYGPQFQALEVLFGGNGEALGRIRLLDSLFNDKYQLHPVLLDACLQVVAAVVPEASQQSYLPVGIERFTLYGEASCCLWSHARLRETSDSTTLMADLQLFSEDGQLHGQIVGLQLKQANRQAVLGKAPWQDWLYEVVWRSEEKHVVRRTSEPFVAPNITGDWLILADRDGIGQNLAKAFSELGMGYLLVYIGQTYERLNGDEIVLNPNQPADWQRLLQASRKYRGVVHLWSEETHSSSVNICGGLLHLIQALTKAKRTPRLWLVTKGAQSVLTGGEKEDVNSMGLWQAPLWGLGKVIALEHPEFSTVCLDLAPDTHLSEVNFLLRELLTPDKENQIAYRMGERHVARLERYRFSQVPISELAEEEIVRKDGSYLITGGLGALGLKVAHWLVEQGARHLVLAGRSGASPANKVISQLEESGAKVSVVRADVAKREDVKKLLIKCPNLRGIVHAAGVLDDGILIQQSAERFEKVMRAKVAGTWNLHTLTATYPLDFFVCFSSVASLVGSPGQGNYAAGNAFMDTLVHYRQAQGLPALSINWGAWAKIGMAAKTEERWAVKGMSSIAPKIGLKIWERLLKENSAQVAVWPINWLEATNLAFPFFEAWLPTSTAGPRFKEQLDAAPVNQRRDLLMGYLREQVSQVIGIKSNRLKPSQRLFELGLDSLMALELRNHLEANLGCTFHSTLLFDYPTLEALENYLSQEVLFARSLEPTELSDANAKQLTLLSDEKELSAFDQFSKDDLLALLNNKLANIESEI